MRRAILLLKLPESQLFNSFQEAIKAAGNWYLYITKNEVPLRGEHFLRLDTEGITDVNGLNEAISNWEQKLANELGASSAEAGFQQRTFGSALSLISRIGCRASDGADTSVALLTTKRKD